MDGCLLCVANRCTRVDAWSGHGVACSFSKRSESQSRLLTLAEAARYANRAILVGRSMPSHIDTTAAQNATRTRQAGRAPKGRFSGAVLNHHFAEAQEFHSLVATTMDVC